jgi:hypothetical protein
MVVRARSRQRKFRPVQLRCVLALLVILYLYAISRLQSRQVTSGVEEGLEGFAAPNGETIVARKNRDKIGVQNVVHEVPLSRNKQKLQDKLDQIFLETGRPYQGDLWEISDYAPQWMKGK